VNLNAAERWFKQALERAPDDGESLGGLGLVAMGRGNAAEAERLLREAVQRAPDSSPLHNNLGEVLRERGRLDEAEPQYRKALELDPDNTSPYGNLGILQAERHEYAEAEKTFRALLARVTGNRRLPALVNLATVCGEQGKLDEAKKLFRQALELAPKHPRVSSSLASFLADHQLKLDEALTLATAAVVAAPNDPNFLDALGWVQAQRGDIDAAERTLQHALELAGQEPPAAEIRAHIEKARAKKLLPNSQPNKESP
jgi:Flp pilus assembly protein TadD